MTTFCTFADEYDTDSDGITITGYDVIQETDKVTTFRHFTKHEQAIKFLHDLNPDLIIWPSGSLTIKPNAFDLR